MIGGYLIQGFQMFLVLALAPLLTGVVRKIKARLTRRQGPPILQPYRDLLRLTRKEAVIAENASWLFPAALVPTFATGLPFSWAADLIAIVALLGSARFFQTLAGMDVGTSFGGIGSSREVMIASLAEPALLMVAFTLSLLAHSTQLSTISEVMRFSQVGLRVSLAMVLVAMILVALAENARIPVDNPATHLELTMIHEAMVLEYSGRHLAMIEFGSALKLLLYMSLIGGVFLPFGIAHVGDPPVQYLIGLGVYLAKLSAAAVMLAVFETSIAKMRIFRVPEFLGSALMLGFLATLLLFVSRGL
jgi:formate hydrogenlyase subunit 4